MTNEELIKYASIYQRLQKRRINQGLYYAGNHPAIYSDVPKESPDNRVPVPIPRKAVAFVTGYMAKPGNIKYSGDFYESKLKSIYDTCEEQVLNAELLASCLKYGVAYTAHWMDGTKQYFAQIPCEQSLMIYDDNIGIFAKPLYFMRFWKDELKQYLDLWDSFNKYRYEYDGFTFKLIDESIHGFKQVPVIEYYVNSDKANLYDHILPLIDILDKGVSEDLANELQRLANSYLLIAGVLDDTEQDTNGETSVDKIKRTKVIDNLNNDVQSSVAFLTKNINPAFINTALDRLERLIYELIGIPNPSDNTFAASSGVALAYKLVPLEYLATLIETYFTRGLQQRIRLISEGQYTLNGEKESNEVQISMTRNLPFDLEAISRITMALKGILSDETILNLFPSQIVPDVQEELKKLEMQSDTLDIVEDTEENKENVK